MKTNYWLIVGTMIATGAVAQVNTNTLPAIPPPANVATVAAPVAPETTNVAAAPAKAPAKKKVAKKKTVKKISEPASALVSGPATVISANLNVRGQAGVKGEVVGHLKAGDTVTVISQINLDKHAADEPAQWAKIALPSGTKVWVDSKFVDATNKIVSVKKLNLRAGPGENFSVLGVIEKGTPVSEISSKGNWSQIETPTNAFAFVSAMFLKQDVLPSAAEMAATVPPTPAATETPAPVPTPTTNNVAEMPPIVAQPAPAADTNAIAETATNVAPAIVDTNPPPPRIVSHEGYVRASMSPVAPTYYELFDWDTGNAINYLYSPTTNLNLGRYSGYKIIVTGPEGMSARWAATPVLTVQKIYVTATNYPPGKKAILSPRASGNNPRAGQRH
ncbi:MAG TPA: SH3 domain-containing protein [Verrucomicrobiae bacterium]